MTKKLLFIAHTDNLRGGGELSLIELIKSAKRRKYQTRVVVPGPGEFAQRAEQIGARATPIRYYYWGRPYSAKENTANISAVKSITDLINEEKVDCVITNTLMIPWGALAAAMTDRPHVWVTRELLTHHHSHLHDNYDFIEAYSNVVFANSKDNASYLQKDIGMNNVRQFYSYVDAAGLKLNTKQTRRRIVYIAARIHPDKDQLELVKALAILQKRNKLPANTLLIGSYKDEDEYFQEIKLFIQQNNLEGKIKFTGYHPKPFELVGPNDIFVRTSKHESLGRAITEAMKLGLICVAADIVSSEEAFELGGGTLYKSGKPEDLADVLAKIISEPDDYSKNAMLAQKRAMENMSEEPSHRPFFTELEKVAKQRNPRRELRHILPQLSGLAETYETIESTAAHYKNLADKRRQDLDNIVDSKAWKTVLFARKVLRR